MSQVLTLSNTGGTQEVDISQSSNTQNIGVSQNGNAQSFTINEVDRVQTIPVTQADDIQSFAVEQQERTQSLSLTNEVTFMKGDPGDKGDPGFSPLIDVIESANGHTVTITDKEGIEQFFVANGESVEEIPISFIEAL